MKPRHVMYSVVLLLAVAAWGLVVRSSMHVSAHSEHQAPCTVITETSACDMSLAEHQASSEVLPSAGSSTLTTLLSALPLLAAVFVSLVMAWGGGGSSGSIWPPPSSRWRLNLHKLFDPLQRLLRSGILASREYEHA